MVDLFEFRQLAATPQQIINWQHPTRPSKLTDARTVGFEGESLELDAVPAAARRQIPDDAFTTHLEPATVARTQQVEAAERAALLTLAEQWRGAS